MRHRDGFTLIELVVVLFILGVVLAMSAAIMRSVTRAQQNTLTTAALARADLALVGYVQTMRRLPCPADGALASSDPGAGREMRTGSTCDNLQAHGVLPWVTLGMREEEALDGYAVRLTYRVGPDLVSDEALNMSSCDAAGAAGPVMGAPGRCEPGCVEHAGGLPGICTKPYNAIVGRGCACRTLRPWP
jgi:prepilin-type N-terminal cleavage/methylation domain-containing protein